MKRALIPAMVATSVLLAGLLGFLAWKRFLAAPPPPPPLPPRAPLAPPHRP